MSQIILAGHVFEKRDLIERVLRNMHAPTKQKQERWVLVKNTFGVGSTVAYALCREFNLDPEEEIK